MLSTCCDACSNSQNMICGSMQSFSTLRGRDPLAVYAKTLTMLQGLLVALKHRVWLSRPISQQPTSPACSRQAVQTAPTIVNAERVLFPMASTASPMVSLTCWVIKPGYNTASMVTIGLGNLTVLCWHPSSCLLLLILLLITVLHAKQLQLGCPGLSMFACSTIMPCQVKRHLHSTDQ